MDLTQNDFVILATGVLVVLTGLANPTVLNLGVALLVGTSAIIYARNRGLDVFSIGKPKQVSEMPAPEPAEPPTCPNCGEPLDERWKEKTCHRTKGG